MESSVEIVQANTALAEHYQNEIAELVHATGPSSYDYHFPKREIFDDIPRFIVKPEFKVAFCFSQAHLSFSLLS